jgi:hypothetical protein
LAAKIYLDIDNSERFLVRNPKEGELLSRIKESRQTGIPLNLEITNLGLLVMDTIILDAKNFAAIVKCTMLYDYRIDKRNAEIEKALITIQEVIASANP